MQLYQHLKINDVSGSRIELSLALLNNSVEKVMIIDDKNEIKFANGPLKSDFV